MDLKEILKKELVKKGSSCFDLWIGVSGLVSKMMTYYNSNNVINKQVFENMKSNNQGQPQLEDTIITNPSGGAAFYFFSSRADLEDFVENNPAWLERTKIQQTTGIECGENDFQIYEILNGSALTSNKGTWLDARMSPANPVSEIEREIGFGEPIEDPEFPDQIPQNQQDLSGFQQNDQNFGGNGGNGGNGGQGFSQQGPGAGQVQNGGNQGNQLGQPQGGLGAGNGTGNQNLGNGNLGNQGQNSQNLPQA